MKKISDFIVNHSILIVIIALIAIIPSIIGYNLTKVNYDVLVYLPSDIDTIKGQNILADDFKIGAYAFVITDNSNNKDIKDLEDKISEIKTVNEVVSIEDVTDVSIPVSMLPDAIVDKINKNDSTIIMVTFSGSTSEDSTIEGIRELRNITGDASRVQSMSAMVVDTMDLANKEIVSYVLIAVILVLIVLYFATDSFIIPLILIMNIGFAIIYNMGTNIFLGSISYITKAIAAVLQLAVTMDFSIFLYDKYNYLKGKYKGDIKKAMSEAIVATSSSVSGSSLTTIAGFLALCGMSLTLGRDIGLVMAKGVLWGLITVVTIFPSLLLLFNNLIDKTKHKVIFPKFNWLQKLAVNKYVLIVAIFILLLIPVIYGNNHVNVYYKLDESLPDSLASKIASKRLKEDYNIVSPEFILVDVNLKGNKLDDLVDKLNNIDGIDLVLAPSQVNNLGIPDTMLPDKIKDIYKTDKYQLIILNSTYEVASDELNNQIDLVSNTIKEYDSNAIVAGEGALTKDLITISNHDFNTVNYISILVIFVIMCIVLKSASLPVILILVIEFAIMGNMSIAYYTNETLPFISSIVIGTIQLGATIDYGILMSNTYLDNRRKGKDKHKAIKDTLGATVPSIIMSALCFFAATFGVYIYSDIDMIGSICELLSRGALISMITVILLLPSLLLIFDKLIIKTTKNMKGCVN